MSALSASLNVSSISLFVGQISFKTENTSIYNWDSGSTYVKKPPFFENLTANRSYVVYALNESCNKLENLKKLKGLRSKFLDYIDELDIEVLQIKNKQLEQIKDSVVQETYWIQLMLTLKFWLDDTSTSFEKTDIFIEKSINASFDLINISPLKSVIDLGKFLIKEKISMN